MNIQVTKEIEVTKEIGAAKEIEIAKGIAEAKESKDIEVAKNIEVTRKGFEASFEEGTFYNRQTQDQEHLENLIVSLQLKGGENILDLGTGSGYLAFELAKQARAKQQDTIYITGLDIVETTLAANREKAKAEKLVHLSFVSYDGVRFPFQDESFDIVVTRYALHHFPAILDTFREITRVLKPNGILLIADPTPNEEDTTRFVDAYMQMKKDGHIKFYTKDEFCQLAESVGLHYDSHFMSSIRFPKKKKDAIEFPEIIKKFPQHIIDSYEVSVEAEEIYITEKVINIKFHK